MLSQEVDKRVFIGVAKIFNLTMILIGTILQYLVGQLQNNVNRFCE